MKSSKLDVALVLATVVAAAAVFSQCSDPQPAAPTAGVQAVDSLAGYVVSGKMKMEQVPDQSILWAWWTEQAPAGWRVFLRLREDCWCGGIQVWAAPGNTGGGLSCIFSRRYVARPVNDMAKPFTYVASIPRADVGNACSWIWVVMANDHPQSPCYIGIWPDGADGYIGNDCRPLEWDPVKDPAVNIYQERERAR